MKKATLFLCILFLVSCSSDTSEPQPQNDNNEETPNDGEGSAPIDEVDAIPYNISVSAMLEEDIYEFSFNKGVLNGDATPLNLPPRLPYFGTENTKLMFWSYIFNGMVWIYDVETKEKTFYENFFELGEDLSRVGPCPVPSGSQITTFFSIDGGDYRQSNVEIYDLQSGEKSLVNLPDSARPESCVFNTHMGVKDFMLYYYDITGGPSYLGVIDLVEKEYTTSVEWPGGGFPLGLSEEEIVFFTLNPIEFYTYNLSTEQYSSPKAIYYETELPDVNTILLHFRSQARINAKFEDNKMLFYNGRAIKIPTLEGFTVYPFGPSILDLTSGELKVFPSGEIYEKYRSISEDRYNLEILQSEIDLNSETIVVTYRDDGYDESPYGIMFFDFDLNLLKQYDLGEMAPLAIIKY